MRSQSRGLRSAHTESARSAPEPAPGVRYQAFVPTLHRFIFADFPARDQPLLAWGSAMAFSHVALLRGINVGGRRRLPMADCRALFEELGCTGVESYVQSGNLWLSVSSQLAKTLPQRAREQIERRHGFDVPVTLRTRRTWLELARTHPLARPGDEARCLHVAFLEGRPSAADLRRLEDRPAEDETLEAKGAHLYVRLPRGVGKAKVNNDWIERRLGMSSTLRNWRTVQKLREGLAARR